MIEFNPLINTCHIGIQAISPAIRSIAYYSHIIPIFFTLFLAALVFFKAPKNILTKIFLSFSIVFSFWLLSDLITWVSDNYFLVYSFWAPIDYIETVMFVLGLYFVMVLVNKSDISWYKKIILFAITLIPSFITIVQKSVLGFNHPYCEAINNIFLLEYRFIVEILIIVIILLYILIPLFKRKNASIINKQQIVTFSLFLFLAIFGSTSYLSAATGFYQLNLYALFIIPLFLMIITYSIFTLDIFNFKILRTQYLVVGLVILIAGQLFFVNGATDRWLTIVTIVISVSLSILLYKNLKRETDQRLRIEDLSSQLVSYNDKLSVANEKLKGLDKLKTEFLSLASHQLRSPLTAIKGYSSMLLEGDYGKIDANTREAIDRIFESSKNLTKVVEDLLNVSKIEQGGMKYEVAPFNLYQMARDEAKEFSIIAEKKGLKLDFEGENEDLCMVNADKEKIRQVLINFIDNSIKYTKNGNIKVSVNNIDGKVVFAIKDSGMGISPEIKESLFEKFARGEGARMNTTGSGLGLYLAKEIAVASKGRVWAESEGMGKGSTFYLELNAIDK